jgi:hypothetical protein
MRRSSLFRTTFTSLDTSNISALRHRMDAAEALCFLGHHHATAKARASDMINDRYGEFTLVPALMADMKDIILKRVAFGSVRDL